MAPRGEEIYAGLRPADEILRESEDFFGQRGRVYTTLRKLADRLDRESIPYAVLGGMALNLPATSTLPRLTFSTIALYRKAFFDSLPAGNPHGLKAPLAPLLRRAMDNQQVSAELYTQAWTDVGTPARLDELNQTPTAGPNP